MSAYGKGLLITGAGVVVLSPDAVLQKLSLAEPATLIFWRFFGIFAVLAIGRRLFGLPPMLESLRAAGFGISFAVAATFAAGTCLFVLSISHTSAANTLVLLASAPLWAAGIAWAWLGEKPPPRTFAAIGAALVAVAATLAGGLGGGGLIGDAMALCLAASTGFLFCLLRKAGDVDSTAMTALGGLIGVIAVLPFAEPFSAPREGLWALAILALLVMPLSFALINMGPRYLPAPEVSLLFLLEMALGPLWVWLAVREAPAPATLFGGALLLATLVVHGALAIRDDRRPDAL